MASEKTKMKRITALTTVISLFGFLYKLGLGIYGMSLVLIIASISTLMVFICKLMFVKNVTKSRKDKKKAYLYIILSCFIYSLIFLLFIVLKVNGIDISSQKEYEGWLGALLIGLMLVMFILSILKLKGALDKTDLMVIGLKEITFFSALADLVIIESYAYGIYITYQTPLDVLVIINNYFPLLMAGLMIVTAFIMFIRYLKYKV